MNMLAKLFGRKNLPPVDEIRTKVIDRRMEDLKNMKTLNKQVRILTEQGGVEIIVRNVKGVIDELK